MNLSAFRDATDYAVDVVMPYLDEFNDSILYMVREVINNNVNGIIPLVENVDVNVNDSEQYAKIKDVVNRFVDYVIDDIEHERDNTGFVSNTAECPYNDVVMDVYEIFTDEVNEAFKANFSFDEFETIDEIIVTGVRIYREQVCVEEINEVIDEFNTYLVDTIMNEISDRYKNGEL